MNSVERIHSSVWEGTGLSQRKVENVLPGWEWASNQATKAPVSREWTGAKHQVTIYTSDGFCAIAKAPRTHQAGFLSGDCLVHLHPLLQKASHPSCVLLSLSLLLDKDLVGFRQLSISDLRQA